MGALQDRLKQLRHEQDPDVSGTPTDLITEQARSSTEPIFAQPDSSPSSDPILAMELQPSPPIDDPFFHTPVPAADGGVDAQNHRASQEEELKSNGGSNPAFAMDRMAARLNVEIFRRRLESEKDETRRQEYQRRLADEEVKLAAAAEPSSDGKQEEFHAAPPLQHMHCADADSMAPANLTSDHPVASQNVGARQPAAPAEPSTSQLPGEKPSQPGPALARRGPTVIDRVLRTGALA